MSERRITPYTGKPTIDILLHDAADIARRVIDPHNPIGQVESHMRYAVLQKLGIDPRTDPVAQEYYHHIRGVRPARRDPRLIMERIVDHQMEINVRGFDHYKEAEKLNKSGHPVVIDGNHLTLADIWPLRRTVARNGYVEQDRNTIAVVGRIENNPIAQILLSSTPRIYVPQEEDAAPKGILLGATRGIDQVLKDPNLMLYVNHEGTRSRTGGLVDPKKGVENLFTRVDNMVVLPIAVEGIDELMPIGSPYIKKGEVTIRFGEPIDISELRRYRSKKDRKTLRSRFEDLVVKQGIAPLHSPKYQGKYR